MTAANYDACLKRVFADEGGYCNDAGDPGGPTKYGITIIDYRKYCKPDATANDVRNMTVDEAKRIYAQRYWAVTRGDAEPDGVDYAAFDYGVNSGVGRAGKVLRKLCDLPTNDWRVTPDVLAAVAKRDPKVLADAMWDERLRFLQSLGTWHLFGAGWGSRVRRGKAASRSMASAIPLTTPGNPGLRTGKGEHPKPPIKTIAGGGAAASGGFFHWIGAHPVASVVIACAVIAAMMYVIHHWHERRQTEPMPGTPVVPVKVGE
jgi:lysozyme family protein